MMRKERLGPLFKRQKIIHLLHSGNAKGYSKREWNNLFTKRVMICLLKKKKN